MKKRTRKLLSLLLCCAILLTLLPVTAMAEGTTGPEYKYIGASLDKTADGEPVKVLLKKILATEPGTLVEEEPLDQTGLYGKYVQGLWYKKDENGTYTEISGNEIRDEDFVAVLTGPTEPGTYRFVLQSAFPENWEADPLVYPVFLTLSFTISQAEVHEHTYGDWVSVDATQHKRTCTAGDDTQYADHAWNNGEVTTAATCTTDGVKTYTCTGCSATKTEAVPATGHDYGDWTFYNETQHKRECAAGDDAQYSNHTMSAWAEDPTTANAESRSCSVCGYWERKIKNTTVTISDQVNENGNYVVGEAGDETTTGIMLPGQTFNDLNDNITGDETATGATIVVGAVSVTYDATTVETINTAVNTAAGASNMSTVSVTLVVEEATDGNSGHTMNENQQVTVNNAAASATDVTVYSITLEVTASGETTTISDFGEGTATVTVPYTEEVGENDTVSVARVKEDGSTTPVVSSYDPEAQTVTWTTNSHSFYMITCGTASVPVCDGGSTCPGHTFTDLDPDEWYHKEVDYAITNGLMNGYPDGSFQPYTKASRAMLVTILYRMEGEPPVGSCTFADVQPGMWYTNAVAWAAEHGIVEGYGNGKFGPEDTLTREQFAVIMYRYAAYKRFDTTARADLNIFTDGKNTSSWAEYAMSWAIAENLYIGFGDSKLNPRGDSSRAQTATVLYRFRENVAQ